MPVAENCHIGAPVYTVSISLLSPSVAGVALFQRQGRSGGRKWSWDRG